MDSEKNKAEKKSPADELRGFQALNHSYNENFKRQAESLTAKIEALYKNAKSL